MFGTGLVRTTGDFGVTGELPSHPELLDWLAVEFRESGWDVKQFFKLLVTSAAYRQSAVDDAGEAAKKTRTTAAISRGPRFRMDAEMVRDYALAVERPARRKIGGPSVKPYQPDGVWEAVAMIGSNTRDYKQRHRRKPLSPQHVHVLEAGGAAGLDGHLQRARTARPAPSAASGPTRRCRPWSTLNDPQFVEAARHLAKWRCCRKISMTNGRLDAIALRLWLGRFARRNARSSALRWPSLRRIMNQPEGRGQAYRRSANRARCGPRCADAGGMDDGGESVDESG